MDIFSKNAFRYLKAHEKMLSITNDWRNANQNNEVFTHIVENDHLPKDLQRLYSAQSVGNRKSSYTMGRDVNG